MAREILRFVAVTRVKRARAGVRAIHATITAALDRARPHLKDQWQLLWPDTADTGDDAAVYLLRFYGDAPLDDWELDQLFVDSHGEDDGKRLVEQLSRCLDGEHNVYVFSGEVPTR